MLLLEWALESWTGNPGSDLGAAMLAEDLDGDGLAELIAGAPGEDRVYVWLGTGDGLAAGPAVTLTGDSGSGFGSALAAGDLDGDGVAELIVGAPDAGAGAAVVVYAPTTTAATTTSLAGATAGDAFGFALATGDLDGDGLDDLVVGAPYADGFAGRTYAFTGAGGLGAAAWEGLGAADAGEQLAIGDFDGDGYADLVVSDNNWVSGELYPGSAAGLPTSATSSLACSEPKHAADLDADAQEDLVCAGYLEGIAWWGDSGGFPAAQSTLYSLSDDTTYYPSSVADLDGDGGAEFAETQYEHGGSDLSSGVLRWSTGVTEDLYADQNVGLVLLPDLDGDGYGAAVFASDDDLYLRPVVVDADGDGYSPDDPHFADCDDADATVHDFADEVVGDGTDQDCDGNDATTDVSPECETFRSWADVEAWYAGARQASDPRRVIDEHEAYGWAWTTAGTWTGEVTPTTHSREARTGTDGAASVSFVSWTESAWEEDYGEFSYSGTSRWLWASSVLGGTSSGVVSARVAHTSVWANGEWDAADSRVINASFTDLSGEIAAAHLETDAYSTEFGRPYETDAATWTYGACTGAEASRVYDWYAGSGTATDGLHSVAWARNEDCQGLAELWLSLDGAGREYDVDTMTVVVPAVDADGDGFGPDEDCDDTDATRHPCAGDTVHDTWPDLDGDGLGDPTAAATPGCGDEPLRATNALDCDDADALVGGVQTAYDDDDGDGHGDPAGSITGCNIPAGFVFTSDDCDDADADVHPGAPERCDAVDRDCDGDPTTGATDTIRIFPDDDGDGYGETDSPRAREACSAPAGFATNDLDCDDDDASVNPGAVDTPGDGLDQDCDGADAPAPAPPSSNAPDADGPDNSQQGCLGGVGLAILPAFTLATFVRRRRDRAR